MKCDVAIIGGGPAGSTVGSLVKLQNPDLNVAIFEAAKFPRHHIGESLLPTTCQVLDEIGVWDKVEAAGFPVKLGGLYRWGATEDLYPLVFLPGKVYEDPPRPSKYEGQRTSTAFHVDRSIFDKILLDHSASLGCQVFEETPIKTVEREGDRVLGLILENGERVEAETYVDASGNRGILRKAFEVGVEAPSALRNIAVYDYWRNAEWGEKSGKDGIYIHVMSIDWGWIWFIVMGKDRTSIGLVTSAEYYKKSGLSTEELYQKAIATEPMVSQLVKSATRENNLRAESDWSYIADRLTGENWFLAGDSCGFADPILSAGVTLAITGSQKVAYSITELKKNNFEPKWLKSEYERVQRGNIRDHIRFADYWYSSNSKFTDLTEYCQEIAKDAGLDLEPDEAFRFLGVGGFSGDAGGFETPGAANFRLSSIKVMVEKFGGVAPNWELEKFTKLRLNLEGAELETSAIYRSGKIEAQQSYRRGSRRLFLQGYTKRAYVALLQTNSKNEVVANMFKYFHGRIPVAEPALLTYIVEVLEGMLTAGWIVGEE